MAPAYSGRRPAEEWHALNLADALQNPGLFTKKAIGKLRRQTVRIPDHGVIEQMNGGVRFEHKRLSFLDEEDMRAMLTRSYDLNLCACLRKRVSPGEIVIDVGANVGYVSAVAASCVGPSGEVHGFEPLTECFERLQVLRRLNPDFRLVFNNVAAGAEKGLLSIGYNPQGDARNATLVPGKQRIENRQVPVWRLDEYIEENISSPERIRVIKIDVEGFEFSVLRGLERFFTGSGLRPLIVCEIKPWEIRHLGYTMNDFEAHMKGFGYQAYNLLRENMCVDLTALEDMETVLFRAN
jgi:FkbM family methyltransferase